MKTFKIILFIVFLVGMIMALTSCSTPEREPLKKDYIITFIGNDIIELRDENNHLINKTCLDSLVYCIEQDNL